MLLRDINGEIIVPGRPLPKLIYDSRAGTLPAWLTQRAASSDTSSTITFGTDADFGPYTQISTGSAASATGGVLGPVYDLTKLAMLRVTVRGLRLSHGTAIGVQLGAWQSGSAAYGARLRQSNSTNPRALLQGFPVGTGGGQNPDQETNYHMRDDGEYIKPRDLSLIIFPATKYVYALEGDSCFAAWQFANLGLSTVTPTIDVLALSSGARSIKFAGIEIESSYL